MKRFLKWYCIITFPILLAAIIFSYVISRSEFYYLHPQTGTESYALFAILSFACLTLLLSWVVIYYRVFFDILSFHNLEIRKYWLKRIVFLGPIGVILYLGFTAQERECRNAKLSNHKSDVDDAPSQPK
jgi:hypothetical protein